MKSPFLRRFGMPSPFVDNEVGAGFSPSILLTGSTAFLWYDPSDVANTNWRRNLLTWTEQFDNAVWQKTNVALTANAGVAPDGTTTAEFLVDDATSGPHRVLQVITPSASTQVFSAYAKKNTSNFVQLLVSNGSANWITVIANLDTGAITQTGVGSVGSITSSSITSVGNGWYRIEVVGAVSGADSFRLCTVPAASGNTLGTGGSVSYAGTSTGILIWGAQLEVGTTATEYQRITDVNTEVIERFPTATLFQDAAGTTPVTAPAQPVGLVLDKSQGLVLGSELVTNGDFSNGSTGWTNASIGTGTISFSGGFLTANRVDVSNEGKARQSISTVSGQTYRLTLTAGGTGTRVFVGTTAGSTNITQQFGFAGSYSFVFVAASATTWLEFNCSLNGGSATYDNFSVRELPGFHATQSTAANRPTYGVVPSRGRVNLLTFTEDFSNAVWSKTNTTVTPPDANGWIRLQATTTAVTLVAQTASGAGSASGNTFTVQVKKGSGATDANRFAIRNSTTSTDLILVAFNYDTGVVSGIGASDVTVTAGANAGEWTLQLRPSSGISAGNNLIVYTCFAGATEASTEFAFVRYPQLELGTTATAYQRVVSQFDVTDPAGFPSYPLHYLFFGGDLDPRWLQTSTITPNADKVQVFAGVRKLSDATTTGLVAELSTDINSANGAFTVRVPSGTAGGQQLTFASKGTTGSIAAGNGYAQPVSLVFTGLGDISGDLSTLRVNGAQTGQSTGDQGTGNYLAYPLFIGRRGGTSLPFNGQLYGLIVRFSAANLDAGLLGQTEKWMGGKTPEMAAPTITGVPTIGVA